MYVLQLAKLAQLLADGQQPLEVIARSDNIQDLILLVHTELLDFPIVSDTPATAVPQDRWTELNIVSETDSIPIARYYKKGSPLFDYAAPPDDKDWLALNIIINMTTLEQRVREVQEAVRRKTIFEWNSLIENTIDVTVRQ